MCCLVVVVPNWIEILFYIIADWSCWWAWNCFFGAADKGQKLLMWLPFSSSNISNVLIWFNLFWLYRIEVEICFQNINRMAYMKRTEFGKVDLDYVLGIGGFDLERLVSTPFFSVLISFISYWRSNCFILMLIWDASVLGLWKCLLICLSVLRHCFEWATS